MKKVLIFSALNTFVIYLSLPFLQVKEYFVFFLFLSLQLLFFFFLRKKSSYTSQTLRKIVFFRFILLEKTIEAIIFFLAL